MVSPLSAAGLQGARSVHEGPAAEAVNITIGVYMPGGLIQELLQASRHGVKWAFTTVQDTRNEGNNNFRL